MYNAHLIIFPHRSIQKIRACRSPLSSEVLNISLRKVDNKSQNKLNIA
jgi:hypothetical protein